jgi:hypothetical protein
MVLIILPLHTTGNEKTVSLQCSAAERQSVAHRTTLVGMQLRVRDHIRPIFLGGDTPT